MKFCWATISVKDLEASIKFYETFVGLRVKRRFKPAPELEIAFLGDASVEGDETLLELTCGHGHVDNKLVEGISIGFQVPSLEVAQAQMRSAGAVIEGPFQPNPMTKFFYVRDPNGVRVQIVEQA